MDQHHKDQLKEEILRTLKSTHKEYLKPQYSFGAIFDMVAEALIPLFEQHAAELHRLNESQRVSIEILGSKIMQLREEKGEFKNYTYTHNED
jgi:hypothetical protein